MSDSKRPTRKRTRRRGRSATQDQSSARQVPVDNTASALDAINTEASILLVDLFTENEGNGLSETHQKTLRKLADSGLDLHALLDNVKSGALSLTLMEELLAKYKLVNMERIDGTKVAPPSANELMIQVNLLIFKEFATLRFNHFTPAQLTLLKTLTLEGHATPELIGMIKQAPKEMLLAINIAASTVERNATPDSQIDAHAIWDYLTAARDKTSGVTLSSEIQRADRAGLTGLKEIQADIEEAYNQQLKQIKERRSGSGRHNRLNQRLVNQNHANVHQNKVAQSQPLDDKQRSASQQAVTTKRQQNKRRQKKTKSDTLIDSSIPQQLQEVKDAVAQKNNAIQAWFAALNSKISSLNKAVTSAVNTFIQSILKTITDLYKAAIYLPAKIFHRGLDTVTKICSSMQGHINKATTKITNKSQQVTQAMGEKLDSASQSLSEKSDSLSKGLQEQKLNLTDRAKSIVSANNSKRQGDSDEQ